MLNFKSRFTHPVKNGTIQLYLIIDQMISYKKTMERLLELRLAGS